MTKRVFCNFALDKKMRDDFLAQAERTGVNRSKYLRNCIQKFNRDPVAATKEMAGLRFANSEKRAQGY